MTTSCLVKASLHCALYECRSVVCPVPSLRHQNVGGMEERWCQWRRLVPVDGASSEEVSVLVAFLILTELIIYFME